MSKVIRNNENVCNSTSPPHLSGVQRPTTELPFASYSPFGRSDHKTPQKGDGRKKQQYSKQTI